DPVVSGRKSLESRTRLPWYNAEKDALQPIKLPAELPELRLPKLSWLTWLVVILLGIVLGCLVYFILNAIRDRAGRDELAKAKIQRAAVADQVEALPFMADRSHLDLLGQAQRYYQQGNFSEAIIY